jgi:hypothetical protein
MVLVETPEDVEELKKFVSLRAQRCVEKEGCQHPSTVAAPERRYIRKRGAVRKYGLTPDQVEEAVKRGLITDCKLGDDGELRINEEELVAKLEEIKKLPHLSEEKRRLLEAASTTCPLCGRTVRPRKRTLTRKALYEGRVTAEEARIVAVVTHFRHVHTDYDRVRRDLSALANFLEPSERGLMLGSLKTYLRLKGRGSRRAWREARKALRRYRELKQKAVENAKRVFTGEAIEKAKQRGLLPQDLTLEEYSKIAKKVLRSWELEAESFSMRAPDS